MAITACAIQKPPSGGPPDTVPPVIVSTEPNNKSTNFNADEVAFEFSKYMNKSKVIENIFISPDIDVNFNWSGKKLYLEFLEELKPQTTYSISLGTDYTDLRGNKPDMSYSIIFSTGNKIDSCKITGKLYSKKPEGTFVFAYYLLGINSDTLNPAHTKPTYRTQIGSNGLFSFGALKPGKYRIFAVRDMMKDGQYDHGTDGFASALNDVFVNDTLSPDIKLKISKPIDDIGPMLYSAEALTKSTVLTEFSESLDSSTIRAASFIILDSTGTKETKIKSAFLLNGTRNKVLIITENALDAKPKWQLQALTNDSKAIRDSSGNIIQDTVSSAYFYAVNDIDTNDLKLVQSFPADSSENIATTAYIDFIFNNSIIHRKDSLIINFIQTKNKSKVPYSFITPQENIIRIVPEQNLESISEYAIGIRNLFVNTDTTLQLTFKTADERNYGGLSGIIIDSSGYNGHYIISLYPKDKNNINNTPFICYTKSKKWKFERLPEGDYTIEIASDINKNEKYDFGKPYPWQPAEKFLKIPGFIHIKPRWTVSDFKIKYQGK